MTPATLSNSAIVASLAQRVEAAASKPAITATVADAQVVEGDLGQTTRARVIVNLAEPSSRAVRLSFQTRPGTAIGAGAARDFTPLRGTIFIPKGSTTGVINVPIRGDNRVEADEAFRVVLTKAVGAKLLPASSGGRSARVSILDDDNTATDPPRIAVTGFLANEGNNGTSTATFTVSLSAASGLPITVDYATTNGTATAGSDYAAAMGTLTFAPGERTKTVSVTLFGDTAAEESETLSLNLSNPVNATLQSAAAVGTIVNDDGNSQTTLTPSVTQGPYFNEYSDAALNRTNITTGTTRPSVQSGVPLNLTFNVFEVRNGVATPLNGARVDVWQADAIGEYSDEASQGTAGETFLRGYFNTNANGSVTFTTIIPGWYPGRTPHIHFMVRTGAAGSLTNRITSQLFFPDALINSIFANSPYNSRGARDTTNATDMVYNTTTTSGGIAGPQLLLDLTQTAGGGYAATYNVYVQGT